MNVFAKKFHTVIRKAREDGTLDIRVSEQELFVETLYTVLCVAGKPVNGPCISPVPHLEWISNLGILIEGQ
ncbi:MAG: hypothetical protein IJR99_15940 [Kiritimatiellae bacterium]|nr:hypothetical protein [Kiritimatiellia bacterium]